MFHVAHASSLAAALRWGALRAAAGRPCLDTYVPREEFITTVVQGRRTGSFIPLTQAACRLRSAWAGLTGPRPVGPSGRMSLRQVRFVMHYSGRTALFSTACFAPFSNPEQPQRSIPPKHLGAEASATARRTKCALAERSRQAACVSGIKSTQVSNPTHPNKNPRCAGSGGLSVFVRVCLAYSAGLTTVSIPAFSRRLSL